MIHTIEFGELSAMLLDFVDSRDGLLFLRMVGAEVAVNAIWAYLSAKESRGAKWGGSVSIPIPGQSHPEYVAAQKRVTYRTLRSRLPSGMVDLAMVHPALTWAEDSHRGFYVLTYTDGVPSGFFERLNQALSIPLKPEWAAWLWTQGQQPQSRLVLENKQVYEEGQYLDKTSLTETTEMPISALSSRGRVQAFRVRCHGRYRDAWLQIIREQLQLGISLTPVPHEAGGQRYENGVWSASPFMTAESSGWRLANDGAVILEAPTLKHLLTQARDELGLPFRVQEERP